MRRAHPHSGTEMDPPAEACCHFRRCALGIVAADARDRHMLWVKWLWGKIRWDGTGAPWDHTTPKCPLWRLHHGTTVHKRLIHCMRWKIAFRNIWLSTWGPWQDTVNEWWNRASAVDLHHVSCLRIPQSLWDHIPRALRVDLRERVACRGPWGTARSLGIVVFGPALVSVPFSGPHCWIHTATC